MCADQVEHDLFQQRRSGRLERVLADEKQFAAWVKKLKVGFDQFHRMSGRGFYRDCAETWDGCAERNSR